MCIIDILESMYSLLKMLITQFIGMMESIIDDTYLREAQTLRGECCLKGLPVSI